MILIPEKQKQNTEINITPMLDMVFILLIFFIITASFTQETGLDISKPKASTAQKTTKENLIIAVNESGKILVKETQVSLNTLQNILRQYAQKSNSSTVVIIADQQTPISVIVDILDRCNLAGIKKTSISAEKK